MHVTQSSQYLIHTGKEYDFNHHELEMSVLITYQLYGNLRCFECRFFFLKAIWIFWHLYFDGHERALSKYGWRPGPMIDSMYSRASLPRFETEFLYFLSVWPWPSFLNSASVSPCRSGGWGWEGRGQGSACSWRMVNKTVWLKSVKGKDRLGETFLLLPMRPVLSVPSGCSSRSTPTMRSLLSPWPPLAKAHLVLRVSCSHGGHCARLPPHQPPSGSSCL